ncbi:hypothetical protein EJ08DRAFT_435267 [Tothia fuscella]|uniref:DNA excision repair protein n=1 Tax=Tothia fuscella TaxID=1048955 RepID=A0A9P4P105_9PEZI|nr:hypothetical protein EJ08DRAFT_435267 [Tothia fuscella]
MNVDEYINHVNNASETEVDDPEDKSQIDRLDSRSDTVTWGGESESKPHKKRKHHEEGIRVDWSDNDDPEAAYIAFKNHKSRQRKIAVAETKRVKAQATSRASKGKRPVSSMVGRRTLRKPKDDSKAKQKQKEEDDCNLEDQLDDEHLPDYLRDRKEKIERRREHLGLAGLRLPPNYDEISFSDDERGANILEKPVLRGKPDKPYEDIVLETSAGIIPAPIAQWLWDYQVEGVQFLHNLFVHNKGGILGDDMGLGKTIQVIAFLTAAFGKTGDERDRKRMRKVRRAGSDRWYPRALIICPKTLIDNWRSELDVWGWWETATYQGNVAEKQSALDAAKSGHLEIMLTTYDTYRNNKSAINTVEWDCVVADEVHKVKGRNSEITQAMIDINTLCRIGLTGTAIQNNYEELYTLLNWANPGRLGSLATWKHSISNPLRLGQAHDASSYQLGTGRRTADKLVNVLLPKFFLRRTKALIAHQLPKKTDRVVFCPLTVTQAEAYQNYIDSDIVEYIRTSTELCDCNSSKKRGWCCYTEIPGVGKWQNYVFPAIMNLTLLANHVALLIPNKNDDIEKRSKKVETLQLAFPQDWKDLSRNTEDLLNSSNSEFCGKWKVLQKLLRFWHANGDKVLVFSRSKQLLRMLDKLFTRTTSYNVSYLDGDLSGPDRTKAVNDFNSNSTQFVFLISTKAGGVGLNITSANKVVIFDPDWNPSYDLQAQDRAYRIGQERDVEVFRLVSAGTIEERIYARQIYKQQQANIGYTASSERRYFSGVQDDKDKKGEIFGLSNLFNYHADGQTLLKEIVNKTNVAESKMGVMITNIDTSQVEDDDPLIGDKEDAAMVQLAGLIEKGFDAEKFEKRSRPKKLDPIQAIFASAGVEYTHENSEVIGTSKTEEKLSRKAAENTNTIDGTNKPVFEPSQDQSFGSDGIQYRYRPPEQVRMRQFFTMAQTFGFTDVTHFALIVEGWTQEQRRTVLDRFYRIRREKLQDEESARGGSSGDYVTVAKDGGSKPTDQEITAKLDDVKEELEESDDEL